MHPYRRVHTQLLVSFVSICAVLALQVVRVGTQGAPSRSLQTENVNGHAAVAGEVLVQFKSTAASNARRLLAQQANADVDVPVGGNGGLRRFHSRNFDVPALIAFLRLQGEVEFVEPNYLRYADVTPNDPSFGNLWGLLNTGQTIGTVTGIAGDDIDAVRAWDVSTGSRSIAVGVIDTGVDYTHPDLQANIWSAPSGFDITVSGAPLHCDAGTHGYNAILHTCDPMDDYFHGTHVSGTIGAVGNNGTGVAGVNWATTIVAGKFLNSSGTGSTSDAIDAIDFMIQAKAHFGSQLNIRVLNNSWGGGAFSTALQNKITDANTAKMLFVAAAGNNSVNIDTTPQYPAAYPLENVLAVAATTSSDLLASFSNYGANTVPLAAPGDLIYSTNLGGGYRYASGTSMATPHVAGAAALVLSVCDLPTKDLKANLIQHVDAVPALTGLVTTGGRLNVNTSIRACAGPPTVPPAPTGLKATAGDAQVQLTWNASSGAASYKVKRSMTSGGPYTTIATGVASTNYLNTGLTNGVTYFYVISAVNSAGESTNSAQASATPGASAPLPPQNLNAVAGDGKVTLTWLPSAGATAYRVKRSVTKTGPFNQIAQITGTAHVDTTVVNGTKYWYVVTAVSAGGESAPSNKDSAKPGAVPLAPTGVKAVTGATAGSITISWNASSGATHYKVLRSTTHNGPYGSGMNTTGLSVIETGLVSGRTYYFVVKAINTIGASPLSAEVSAVAR